MEAFLYDSGLTPHGFCLLWEPGLIWLHAGSDCLIALAYFSIPVLLLFLLRKRPSLTSGRMFWLFGAFILACGVTHAMAVVTLWVPVYYLEGAFKTLTAALSVGTACLLWPMMEAAQRSEARFRMLAENAADLLFELDLSLKPVYVSPASDELLGLRADDVAALGSMGLVHPQDQSLVRATWRSVASGHEPRAVATYRCRRGDGSWIWVETVVRLIEDLRGRPVNLLGMARDVSQRKAAEDTLRASEERYRMLAENMSDAIGCLDRNFCRTYASPSFLGLTGYAPEELVGQPAQKLVLPEDWPAVREMLSAALDGAEREAMQFRILRKDGRVTWTELTARLMSDGTGLTTALRDVSARKAAEDQLLAANAQLAVAARIDSLTSLANRRHLDESLEIDFRRCMREGSLLSLILIDVDRFKDFNDQYGHPAGDACLRQIGAAARNWARRPDDLVARYGGEEFAVVLPQTTCLDAAGLAESIRMAIRDLRLAHKGNPDGIVTASFGVATIDPARRQEQVADLVSRADRQLYAAKSRGRDNVQVDRAGALEGEAAAPP